MRLGGWSRSPHGERGLKWLDGHPLRSQLLSLPPRGAWIEIHRPYTTGSTSAGRSPHGERGLKSYRRGMESDRPGRSPHGERGLKCIDKKRFTRTASSLPPRGAWIEMPEIARDTVVLQSLPPRGAWIEMNLWFPHSHLGFGLPCCTISSVHNGFEL